MKNNHIKSLLIIALVIPFAILSSCKKGSKGDPSDQEILNNKIGDVIPKQYLDTLAKLKFPINQGTTPPNMEGGYFANNITLKASNISGDRVGDTFNDSKFKVFSQSTKDFGVSLIGEYFVSIKDTSIVTAISGSGNNFTIYGKIKSSLGSGSAIFAIILSGTKEGNNIKNYTLGIINIDNSKGGFQFVPEGKARIAYDADLVSEGIDYEKKVLSVSPAKLGLNSLLKSGKIGVLK